MPQGQRGEDEFLAPGPFYGSRQTRDGLMGRTTADEPHPSEEVFRFCTTRHLRAGHGAA